MSGWRNLVAADQEVFGPGLVLRFSTKEVRGGGPLVVIAVTVPGTKALSFFALDGNNAPGFPMGYQKPTLPEASTDQGSPYSVRKDWLLANFDEICAGVDPAAIEYAEYFTIMPLEVEPPAEEDDVSEEDRAAATG